MSFFDEVETTVANTRFLQAVEDNAPIVLALSPYAELKDFESKVREKLTLRRLLRPNTVGYYLFKQFLQQEKMEDVRGLLSALDEYRKAHAGQRRGRAQKLLMEQLDVKENVFSSRRSTVHQPGQQQQSVNLPGELNSSTPKVPDGTRGDLRGWSIVGADTKHLESKHAVGADGLLGSTPAPDSPQAMPATPDQAALVPPHSLDGGAVGANHVDIGSPPNQNVTGRVSVAIHHPPAGDAAAAAAAQSSAAQSTDPSQNTGLAYHYADGSNSAGTGAGASSAQPASETAAAAASENRTLRTESGVANAPTTSPDGIVPTMTLTVTSPDTGAGERASDREVVQSPPSPDTPGPVALAGDDSKEPLAGSQNQGNSSGQLLSAAAASPGFAPVVVPGGAPASASAAAPLSLEATGTVSTSGITLSASAAAQQAASASSGPSLSGSTKTGVLGALARNNVMLETVLKHMDFNPTLELFDPLLDALSEVIKDKFAGFLQTEAYKKYIQLEHYARQPVKLKDFRVFRVLGRGAFGAVSAVQKIDTHAIFAMKEMNKRQVKANQSEWMVNNEKKVLSKMRSPFVLNLKYSFHNEESLYLIFDMCSGGDLKFHLRNPNPGAAAAAGAKSPVTGAFSNERSRFYAAEVLLGLEHIHSFDIVYRDLKPNNILLDTQGHVKISDLGLTIKLRKNKVLKHLAGTAGYWAPEIVMKTGTYKTSDYWSFGVFLYEMLSGKRPRCKCGKKSLEWCPYGQKRTMEENAVHPEGGEKTLRIDVDYPPDRFTPEARDLLQKLFHIDPMKRLGANGPQEIKNHAYFAPIDWNRLEALDLEPPFVPDARTVNANSIGEVGEFNKGKFRKIKMTPEDEKHYENFTYISAEWVQEELVTALMKQDNPPPNQETQTAAPTSGGGCCNVM